MNHGPPPENMNCSYRYAIFDVRLGILGTSSGMIELLAILRRASRSRPKRCCSLRSCPRWWSKRTLALCPSARVPRIRHGRWFRGSPDASLDPAQSCSGSERRKQVAYSSVGSASRPPRVLLPPPEFDTAPWHHCPIRSLERVAPSDRDTRSLNELPGFVPPLLPGQPLRLQ